MDGKVKKFVRATRARKLELKQITAEAEALAGGPLEQPQILRVSIAGNTLKPETAEQVRASMAGLMVDAGLTKAATAHALLTLVPDTTTESFHAARLNSLIGDLLGRGHAGIAAEIVATKKKTTRKGYLMVKPNKD